MRAAASACAALAVTVLAASGAPGAAASGAAGARSPFAWRGIVEGSYGRPWTHPERVRMLRWMAAHGMNVYVHAPKDDLRQRAYWREPYPAPELRAYRAEIRLAARLGVRWVPNVSPALPLIPSRTLPGRPASRPLCFSCPGDLEAVLAKLGPFTRAGARTFMASFDDVRKTFSDPRDTAAFGAGDAAYGRATGGFLTRLRAALRRRWRGSRLLTVVADYAGSADSGYLRGLRSRLAGGIEVLWTGTSIPARQWTRGDARAYGRLIGRRPLVWENWTNVDAAAGTRIFLGPYVRRTDVRGAVGGFLFNPANDPDLNLLPLATAADWMRDPGRYRPRRSWLDAVRALAGPGRRRDLLRAWAETSYSTKLDYTDAPTFARAARAFLRAYRAGGDSGAARARLVRELLAVRDAGRGLRSLPDRALVTQAAPFLDAARVAAGAGLAGIRLLAAERPAIALRRAPEGGFRLRLAPPAVAATGALRASFGRAAARFAAQRRLVYGWRGGMAVDFPPFPVPPNAMDTFLGRVRALDAAFAPLARRAASDLAATLDGRALRPGAGRRAWLLLPRSACAGLLVVRDGAGGRTALRLPACRGGRGR